MQAIWREFLNPPDTSRPRVWWHWMNGNIDKPGILADLKWMKSVGIGGVQIFEGGLGAPQIVRDRLVYKSAEWLDAFDFAVKTANDLGLDVTIATSAGWSALGGHWVAPDDAMKKIVWSETRVSGSKDSSGLESQTLQLNKLPTCDGLIQDAPLWGAKDSTNFGDKFATLAVPFKAYMASKKPNHIEIDRDYNGSLDCLTDNSLASWIEIKRDPNGYDQVSLTYGFDVPQTVGSARIGLPGPKGFGAPFLPDAKLEASFDGEAYFHIADFEMGYDAGQAGEVPQRTISFAPVTAEKFRVTLYGRPITESIPEIMPEVRGLPYRPVGFDAFHVSEFELFGGGRVHGAEYKAGFGTAADYWQLEPDAIKGQPTIDLNTVIDLTEKVDDQGLLHWQVPQGEWLIVQFGYSLTGHKNGPAPAEATGLEVDKLDSSRVKTYLNQFYGPIFEQLGGTERLASVLSDSIESGAQNYTEGLLDEFEVARGYSLKPWLLAVAGFVVESAEETDRVLWDLRRTLTDMFAESMYGTVADFAHEHGLTYYAEALEDHRPQLGDDLQMRSKADVPMGAMWSYLGAAKPQRTYLADLKGASSVAHVYGKDFTGAESFSTFGKPFVMSPQTLKPVADLELVLGVTRFCIHSSPHQPSAVRAPGVTMAPTLGQVFTRNETWAGQAGPWVDYLSRCSHLLNQGNPVADLLYFVGEEAPVTALWGDTNFDVPSGIDFDLISRDGLTSTLRVQDSLILSAQGTYKALYLGGHSSRLSVAVLRALEHLASAGAKVYGLRPVGSPSAADDKSEFLGLVERLWGGLKPLICSAESVAEAIRLAKIKRDWRFRARGQRLDAALVPAAQIRATHRRLDDCDVYFIANPSDEPLKVSAKLRSLATNVWWFDPANPNASKRLKAKPNKSSTKLKLKLPSYGSGFVVFGSKPLAEVGLRGQKVASIDLNQRWSMSFEVDSQSEIDLDVTQLNLVNHSNPRIAHHSGRSIFAKDFEVSSEQLESCVLAELIFESFADVLEIQVNEQPGLVVWSRGQSPDISAFLKPGKNHLRVVAINNWFNRLLGDERGLERFEGADPTYLSGQIFTELAEPIPAGLLGSVRLDFFASNTPNNYLPGEYTDA